MADLQPSGDDPGVRQASPPKAPRWVKVSAIVALILILLLAALALFGGGRHGPARHTSGDGGGRAASIVTGGYAEDAAGLPAALGW